MKYIKLFEELNQHYQTSPFGWDDRDKKEAFFIVTEDENWMLRNTIDKDSESWPNYLYNQVSMTPVNGGEFPDEIHRLSFKSKKDAQKFINNININDFKGKMYFQSYGHAYEVSKNMKYDSEYVGNHLLVNIKDNLKIVSFMSGLIRTDIKPFLFI